MMVNFYSDDGTEEDSRQVGAASSLAPPEVVSLFFLQKKNHDGKA